MILTRAVLIFATLLLPVFAAVADSETSQTELQRRQQYLQESLSINRSRNGRYPMTTRLDATWTDWQKRTGELPPDFSRMLSRPHLPDPLLWQDQDGTTTEIKTIEQWERKRAWIKEQFQHWISGTVPPPPGNVTGAILDERNENGAIVQMIELQFGPDNQGRMTFELLIPPGNKPRPVYMTQWNHRDWAQLAVRRGYIGCVYAGADLKDDTDAYQSLYPDYEFSRLMRRAWGASRVVDYLLTRPEVNAKQIAITGHSRNGKQSLWAAAFDERIGAVITSSCGTGGITPWRYSDPQYCNETLDAITSIANTWFHPRLRFFFGREDRLPIDQNELLSLIAPRPLLMHYSEMEHQANPWVAELCFRSVRTVYDFLGSPGKIGLFSRAGEHAVAARDVERCIDFLDIHFERRTLPWENTLAFDYDFENWNVQQSSTALYATPPTPVRLKAEYGKVGEFEQDKARILRGLTWLLGNEPAGVKPHEIAATEPSRVDWMDSITSRPSLKGANLLKIGPYTAMGDHLAGYLYYPQTKKKNQATTTSEKFPVIIYLHQYAYAHGYAYGYNSNGGGGGSRRVLQQMVDNGYAVLAIDMFGFGTRWKEAQHFYQRQPEWSKMGKMVADVSACVDAAHAFDFLDRDRIYVVGDTIGGSVGLMAAARDERIAGIAVVAAFSPWRNSNSQYESIRNFSHLHGFMPRLGLFADTPSEVPVDYDEILACIAPRKLLIIAPSLDRHSDSEAVKRTVDQVNRVYELKGASDGIRLSQPLEINRMTEKMESEILEFFSETP